MKRKTFYGFLALILTVGIVIACGVGSSWFTNGNIKTWFNSWGQAEKEKVETYAQAVTSTPIGCATAFSENEDGGIVPLSSTWETCPDCYNASDFTRVAVEPTCTNGGSSEYHCDYCDADFVVANISALGHTDPVLVTVTEPTCTTTGYQVNKCSRCWAETGGGNTLAVLGHSPVLGDYSAPTCTTTGYQAYKCSSCGVETSRTILQALSHDLTKLVESEEFYNIYECTTCNLRVVSFKGTPEKEGHTFAGWYYGNGDNCGEDCRAYVGEALYSDVDFHSHFTINVITVTYISDGEEYSSEYIDWNTTANLPIPEKTGYNFEGWYYSDGTKYEGQAIKLNTTLTAKWAIKRITVNFFVNGSLYTTIEVDYGTVMESLNSAAAEHYLEILSLTDENGEVVDLSDGVTTSLNIEAEKMTTWNKAVTFLKLNWLWLTIGAAVLIGIGVTAGVVSKKKSG